MTPFDVYKQYLAIKNHFSKSNYDYFKYAGKSRASIKSFNTRKDKYWFERMSRQKTDDEIKNYYVANFVDTDTPDRLWIGEIFRDGEQKYQNWMKRQQSLSYLFKEQSQTIFLDYDLDEIFDTSKTHPIILKKFLSGNVTIETMVIYNKIFLYSDIFDRKLKDPVWESVSLKIRKYSPFLNIDIKQYKKYLKTIIGEK
jgi:hypothetical protein